MCIYNLGTHLTITHLFYFLGRMEKKMETKNIHGKIAFVAALFVTSVFVLGIKLLNPTPIQIFVNGNNVVTKQIPGFFTYTDVVILVIAALVLGISGAYLLFSVPVPAEKPPAAEDAGKVILEERKKKWGGLSKTLKDDERKIYETILESDGIIDQSEIVEKTGLPKANVSRGLDLLESKGLAERRRRGTGNVVLLK
ncbi:hypothetical protein C5S32_02620 [ANME-1 cluster archaeon GoMg1]|nr:hypothetical protein [ANME-1 cluster archaeon GoMg1]